MINPRRGNYYMLFLVLYMFFATIVIGFVFGEQFMQLSVPVATVLNQVVVFLPPFVVYLIVTGRKVTDVLPIKALSLKNVLLIVAICIVSQPVMFFLSALSAMFFNNNAAGLMEDLSSYNFLVMTLTVSITPSIFEEINLRGVIFSEHRKVALWKAALVNGIFFGIMHLDPQQFLYAALLGFLFVYFVHYTGSIVASMLGHFTINFVQSSIAFYAFSAQESMDVSTAPEIPDFTTVAVMGGVMILFLPFLVLLIRYFIRYNKKCNAEIVEGSLVAEEKVDSYEENVERHGIFGIGFWCTVGIYLVIMLLLYAGTAALNSMG